MKLYFVHLGSILPIIFVSPHPSLLKQVITRGELVVLPRNAIGALRLDKSVFC